jgi:hypothetical protein
MEKHVRMPIKLLIVFSMMLAAGLTCMEASPISYVFSGTGFGTFNGIEFNEAVFSINLSGDTLNVKNDAGQFINENLSGTISASGPDINLPVTAFAVPLTIFLDPGSLIVGFFDPAGSNDFLDYDSADLAGYDLKSAFGPIPASLLFASDMALAGGNTIAFEEADKASFAAVPEPTFIALLALGLIGVSLLRLRVKSGYSVAD